MKSLFDATKIKGLALENRFARSATWLGFAEKNGHFNEDIYRIYGELAKGGVGFIVTSFAYVTREEHPNNRMLGVYDDSFIPEYQRLAELVHAHNGKIAVQLVYGGSQNICYEEDKRKMDVLGPSAVYNARSGITPKEATKEEIRWIVASFARAAERVKQAGMDAVQIHAAHGYLLSQWLTPFYNRRVDEYGGDIGGRARIVYETYQAVRNAVGEDFPVMIKLNCSDLMKEGGLVEGDALEVYRRLDEMGMDLIEVSGGNTSGIGNFESTARRHLKRREDQSYFSPFAARAAREMKHAKIMLTGGNLSYGRMNELLNQTGIEYFGLSRPLICESDLINKWRKDAGYPPKCISCNGCLTRNGHHVDEKIRCVLKTNGGI